MNPLKLDEPSVVNSNSFNCPLDEINDLEGIKYMLEHRVAEWTHEWKQ
jgi:hypothetical protein